MQSSDKMHRTSLSIVFCSSTIFFFFVFFSFSFVPYLVLTYSRYPKEDHSDFAFETRLGQFACAPISLFQRKRQFGEDSSSSAAAGAAEHEVKSGEFDASEASASPDYVVQTSLDGRRVIIHSCVLARAADLPDVYVVLCCLVLSLCT